LAKNRVKNGIKKIEKITKKIEKKWHLKYEILEKNNNNGYFWPNKEANNKKSKHFYLI